MYRRLAPAGSRRACRALAACFVVALFATIAHAEPTAGAGSADLVRQTLRFGGRLHPMLVHFPVGLLVTAALLELLAVRFHALRPGARACLHIGAVAAAVAAGAGWLNANLEPHGRAVARSIEVHRWTGVACAACALLASLCAAIEARRARPFWTNAYRYALVAAVLLVSFAGHVGGSIVHGEDYALRAFEAWRASARRAVPPAPLPTEPLPTEPLPLDAIAPPQDPDPAPAQEPQEPQEPREPAHADEPPDQPAVRIDFAREILPIFAAHCHECHGPDRQKGGLALHERAGAFPEDRSRWTIVPGDAEGSLMLELLRLPADDPEAMPADAAPLAPELIDRIERWIRAGAEWPPDDRGA